MGSSKRSNFNGHVFLICCDNTLYFKMLQVQLDNGLGKAFAGMLVNVYGLNSMGLLSEAEFELYKNKYSVTLEEVKARKNKSPVEIAYEQTRANYCRTARAEFGNVLNQWVTMKPRSKHYWIKKAKLPENAKIKNAKLILELAEQEVNRLES